MAIRDPFFVTLATHDEVPIRHRPHLPSTIIRYRGDDIFLRAKGQPQNSIHDIRRQAKSGVFQNKDLFIIGQNCLNRTFSSAFLVFTKFRSCIHVLLAFYRFRKWNEYMYRMSNIRLIFLQLISSKRISRIKKYFVRSNIYFSYFDEKSTIFWKYTKLRVYTFRS